MITIIFYFQKAFEVNSFQKLGTNLKAKMANIVWEGLINVHFPSYYDKGRGGSWGGERYEGSHALGTAGQRQWACKWLSLMSHEILHFLGMCEKRILSQMFQLKCQNIAWGAQDLATKTNHSLMPVRFRWYYNHTIKI